MTMRRRIIEMPVLVFLVMALFHVVGASLDNSTLGRIQYGKPAKKGSFPYFIRLSIVDKSNDEYICGGFLYSPDVVITAAHCGANEKKKISFKEIRAYSNGDGGLEGVSSRKAIGYIIPKSWGGKRLDGDIMLVKLSKSFDAKTLSLSKKLPKPGTQLHIMGVGADEDRGDHDYDYDYDYEYEDESRSSGSFVTNAVGRALRSQYNLLEAKVPMLSTADANKYVDKVGGSKMERDHFGAGFDKEHQDACVGDSGGPIIQQLKTSGGSSYPVAVGIVSYGYSKCGQKNPVGFYTSIPYYRSWIQDAVKKRTWVRV